MRSFLRGLFPVHTLGTPERRLLWLIWLLGLVQGFSQAPLSGLVPYTRVALGLSEGDMSLVLSVARLASVGAILFSLWGDRGGRRRPFLVSYALLIATSGITAMSRGAVAFTASQAGVRLSATALTTVATVLLAEQVPAEARAFAIGVYAAAASLGAGGAQAMIPVAAIGPETWRWAFAVPLLGLCLLPFLRRVTESPLHATAAHAKVGDLVTGRWRRRFWISGVAALLAAAFPGLGLAFTNERLISDLGLAPGTAITITLVSGTIGATGVWLGGRAADVWGRRPTTVASLIVTIAGGLALYQVETPAALLVALALGAFGTFAYVPAASTHRVELFPTRLRATAGTAGAYLGTIGSALGLAYGAITIDTIGLAAALRWLALAHLAAAALTLLLPETKGHGLESVA